MQYAQGSAQPVCTRSVNAVRPATPGSIAAPQLPSPSPKRSAVVVGAAVALALTGPGTYSADELLNVHLPEPLTLIVGTLATIAGVAIAIATRSAAVAPKPEAG